MKEILIVCKETFLRQVKSWSFLLMVISPFIFIAFSMGVGYISGNSASKNDKIAIVVPDKAMEKAFQNIEDKTFSYKSETTAAKALKNEKISAYLIVEAKDAQIQGRYKSNDSLGSSQKVMLEQSLGLLQNQINIQQAQISSDQLKTLSQEPQLKVETEKKNQYNAISKYISFFGVIFIMYFIILIYASQTAQEIASEKGTKIMEVIFSSVSAENYFYGRILGIFAVILTHVSIYVIGGLVTHHLANKMDNMKAMIAGSKPLIESVFKHLDWSILAFGVLGILIYVILAALCGSLVVRPEQAQQAAQPVMYLVIAGFVGSFLFGQEGSDVLLLKIGSYIPFISTFFMPIRLINGYADLTQSLISLAILALSAFLLTNFIGKSYSGLILQTDDIGFFKGLKKGLAHK
ncbi:sodium ABC transporter permease [Streptococcus penaeicida]|uniref:Sodium ABC transporter permease n=1 Tax=Streptococcus penaeicida TaxID=1765960 RepID=A0A2N8LBT7_9STRE|nr:ABC transporter permease [Streptococcus penaeicida]PND47627.1 sodium ABC transporter permease [Streptococcus penaeicida]